MVADAPCTPRRLENLKPFRSLARHVGNGGAKSIAVVAAVGGPQGDVLRGFSELQSLATQVLVHVLLQLPLLQ